MNRCIAVILLFLTQTAWANGYCDNSTMTIHNHSSQTLVVTNVESIKKCVRSGKAPFRCIESYNGHLSIGEGMQLRAGEHLTINAKSTPGSDGDVYGKVSFTGTDHSFDMEYYLHSGFWWGPCTPTIDIKHTSASPLKSKVSATKGVPAEARVHISDA